MRDELETPRLRLRRWHPDDLATLVRWQSDPELMRYMGKLSFTHEETAAGLARYEHHWAQHGFGLWAVEEKDAGALIGRAGVAYHREWPHDPEVGWLIDTPWQGRGLATEAGAACLRYAFDELGFERIVTICTAENAPSRRVMDKLGFRFWHELYDAKLDLDLLLHVRERRD